MEQAAIIPVVKWIRNGYASELPVYIDVGDEQVQNNKNKDPMDLEDYDREDSNVN